MKGQFYQEGSKKLGILIRGGHETCDSCKKIKKVNIIFAGDIGKSDVNQMVLCDDCTETLHSLISK